MVRSAVPAFRSLTLDDLRGLAMPRDEYVWKPLYPRRETRELLGCGDTRLQELLIAKELRAKKFGKTVLIKGDSLKAFIESLPDAEFGNNPPVRRPKDDTTRLEDDTPGASQSQPAAPAKSQRTARSAPSKGRPTPGASQPITA